MKTYFQMMFEVIKFGVIMCICSGFLGFFLGVSYSFAKMGARFFIH